MHVKYVKKYNIAVCKHQLSAKFDIYFQVIDHNIKPRLLACLELN